MAYYALKILVSAALVATISEVAKRNSFLAAFVASLPVISVLSFIWMHVEAVPDAKIATLAGEIFWLVLPSLLLFLALPFLLRVGWGFWPSLISSLLLTAASYVVLVLVCQKVGLLS